jgi:heme-degrading monooxygenase HmoA
MEEFKRLYEQQVIPALRSVKGCRYIYLTERANRRDEVISVTSWDSKADAEAYEQSGKFVKLLESQRHVLSGLYQWKIETGRRSGESIATSDDMTVEQYNVLAGRSFT